MESRHCNELASAKVRAMMISRSWTGRTLKEKCLANIRDTENATVFQGFVEIVPLFEDAEAGLRV